MDVLNFERILVQQLFLDTDYRDSVFPFIKPDYFISDGVQSIVKSLVEFNREYDSFPTPTEYRNLYRGGESDKLVRELDNCLSIKNDGDMAWNKDLLIDDTEEFIRIKKNIDQCTAIHTLSTSDDPDFDAIGKEIEKLNETNSFTFDRSVGMDVHKDIEKFYDFLHRKDVFIPTNLQQLNQMISGGTTNGTLNLLMAEVNMGKSMAMVSLMAGFLQQNKKCLYLSLEMSEEQITHRLLSNLMEVKMGEMYMMPKKSFFNAYDRIAKYIQNNAVIKQETPKSMNANGIRRLLKDLKTKQGFVPDIIFIDYLGLLTANYRNKGDNSYTEMKNVSEEIRGLAIDYKVPIWSAVQTNRGGMGNLDVDFDDISDSIGSAMTADLMIALTRDEALKAEGLAQAKIIKNRFGLNKQKFLVRMDYDYMRVLDHSDDLEQSASFANAITNSMSSLSGLIPKETNSIKF